MDARYSPTGAAEIDTDAFPVVVQRMRAPLQDADVDWMIARFTAVLDRRQRHATIVWPASTIDTPMSAAQRRRFGDWEQSEAHRIARYNVCTAVVLKSRLQRHAYTALRWMSPAASPQLVFPSFVDAERWVHEMLAADGHRGPSRESIPPSGF